MYASFFGLNEKPFAITPDPRYLYLGRRHAEALAHLLYGITESGGFIQLTGEVGTGKTTVVRSLLEQLPEHADVALVLNPRLSPHEFLLTILDELHIEVPDRDSLKSIVDALNARLLEAHAAGRRVVLIVDEAQNLSTDVLEQIRLLTNLETAKQKLLQIILIGQPELREVLDRSDLRQLAQRITARYHLEPLEADELEAYLRHRLEVAGSRAQLFSPGAIKTLHRSSGGIPRLVNVLADRALLGAWSQEESTVSGAMARKAANEVFGEHSSKKRRTAHRSSSLLLGLAGVVIAILAGIIAAMWIERPAPPPAALAVEPARPIQRVPVVAPVAEPVQRSAEPAPPPAVPDTGPPASGAVAETSAALPVAAAPAAAAPLAGESLGEMLARGALATGTDAAFSGLFGRWGLEYNLEDGAACDQAMATGLRCLLHRGTWGEVAGFDRPAILVLTDRAGRDHQVVLNRLVGDSAELLAGETMLQVPLSELLLLWYGEYLLLWRPEVGDGRVLTRNAAGADVLWLRRALGELRGAPVLPANSDIYDPPLEAAVREFQRSARIAVDGAAGAMTFLSVNNALGLDGRPRLREAQ
jgi:general secretion pathway protein A